MGHRKKIPIEEMIEKRKQGEKQSDLAKDYGIAQSGISVRIKEYYDTMGMQDEGKKDVVKRKEIPIEEIVDKWKKGKTQKELSDEYGVSEWLISQRIKEYYKTTKSKFKVLKATSIIVEYLKKGLSPDEIELIALRNNIIIPEDAMKKAIEKMNQIKSLGKQEGNSK